MSDHPPSNACPKCGAALPSAATSGLCPRCLMAEAMLPTQADAAPAPHGKILTPEQLAPHFPQLEILECLGRGGMGVVYKARQKSLNRLVALKLLAPERVTDAQFAERFAREAQALAALNHPHIVTVYDFGVVDAVAPRNGDAAANAPVPHAKMFFLLMEFVDGVNLRQAMKAGRFTPEQALAVVPPVCEALQYAHEHGIVHRDIKPENLLLDKEGRVKIADFGIAKILGAPVSEPAVGDGKLNSPNQSSALHEPTLASLAGTPQYMAPEQRTHRATDHRADIYSLGVVLYELLTGELPADKLQPPSRKVQIDVRLDEIVLRALEKSPELRYQTASEFRTQVVTMTSGASAPIHAAAVPPQPSQPRWHGWDVWVIAICLVTFGALWLDRLQRSIHEGGRALVPNEASHVMLNSALATLILLVGAAFLWMLAKNIKAAPAWRVASGKRFLGRTLVPAIAVAVLVRTFVAQPFSAATDAAAPEIPRGSHVLVWKLTRTFAAGDLIAYMQDGRVNLGRVAYSGDDEISKAGVGGDREIINHARSGKNVTIVTRNGEEPVLIPPATIIGKVMSVYWRATPQANDAGMPHGEFTAATGTGTITQMPEMPGERRSAAAAQLVQDGWQLLQAGKLAEARAKCGEAVKLAPSDPDVWNGLGWVEFNSQNREAAEKVFQKVLTLNPDHAAALNGLGQIFFARREYEKAEPFFVKSATNGAPAAWFGLAKIYLLQGRFEDAEKWAQMLEDSAQGDAFTKKLLEAAKAKKLSEGLRMMIEPVGVKPSAPKSAVQPFAADDSISLAQAVNDFNKRHHEAAVTAKQPDLTVGSVLAAVRWAMRDRAKLSVTNETFAALGWMIETQVLPKDFELELLTGYQPDDKSTFDVWSVRLRIPGTVIPGGTTCISIHEQQLGSRTIGKHERAVRERWQKNPLSFEGEPVPLNPNKNGLPQGPYISVSTYDEELKAAIAKDLAENAAAAPETKDKQNKPASDAAHSSKPSN